MSKRANPFHTAQKSLNKARRLYAEQNKKDEDLGTYHLTDYYFRDGLRFVHPYYYTFKSFVKRRWVGEKLKDIYVKEFRGESEETLMKRFAAGSIAVNGEPVKDDYVIKDNDFIEATMHRHEMPVKADEVSIVHNGDKFYVVNKPASIPVHPAGRFRYNSLSFILGKTLGMKKLSTVHRLDRLTSGCQIFAKDSDTARKCFDALKSRKVSKLYVTGVKGEFPEKEINCDAPIGPICSRIGINAVSQSRGQNCVTTLNRVHYDKSKDMSLVVCKPLTGRTHQIRVHAQYLGHPVINDPLYGTKAWGDVKGRNIDELDEQAQTDIIDKLRAEHDSTCGMEWRNKNKFIKKSSPVEGSNNSSKSDETTSHFDPICEECGVDFEDPPFSQLEIYLHAYRYEILDQLFVAPLPHWAKQYELLVEDFVNKSLVPICETENKESLISNEMKPDVPSDLAKTETVECLVNESLV